MGLTLWNLWKGNWRLWVPQTTLGEPLLESTNDLAICNWWGKHSSLWSSRSWVIVSQSRMEERASAHASLIDHPPLATGKQALHGRSTEKCPSWSRKWQLHHNGPVVSERVTSHHHWEPLGTLRQSMHYDCSPPSVPCKPTWCHIAHTYFPDTNQRHPVLAVATLPLTSFHPNLLLPPSSFHPAHGQASYPCVHLCSGC